MDVEAETLTPVAETPQPLLFSGGPESPAEVLVAEARRRRASHIHLEISSEATVVRMRIAGQLTEPRHYHADTELAVRFRHAAGASLLGGGGWGAWRGGTGASGRWKRSACAASRSTRFCPRCVAAGWCWSPGRRAR